MRRTTKEIVTKLEMIEDFDSLPRAHQTGWYMCDQCCSLHVMLKGKDGEPFAAATFDEEMLVDMLAVVRGRATQ
jgi:hypothetical protein